MDNLILDEQLLLNSKLFVESRNYWLQHLKENSPENDSSLFSGKSSNAETIRYCFTLEDELCKHLLQRCNSNELSVYIYIIAAYSILVHTYTTAGEVLMAVPPFKEAPDGFEKPYNSLLPLVCSVKKENTFKQQLLACTETIVSCMTHQHYPLSKIYAALYLDLDSRIFDTVFVNDSLQVPFQMDSKRAHLLINPEIKDHEIVISMETTVDMPFTAGQLFNHLQQVIRASVKDINIPVKDIPLLTNHETNTLRSWSDGQPVVDTAFSLVHTITSNLETRQAATAIISKNEKITYAGLQAQVNKLSAWLLNEKKLVKGDRVAVLLHRSEWMLISLLSLLKNGLVYVPVDSGYPPERIRFILEDIQPSLLITEEEWLREYEVDAVAASFLRSLPDAAGPAPEKTIPAGTDEAYIIYTSGSTGNPKGVVVTHGNLNHFFNHVQYAYAADGPLTMPFIASNAFDISLFQLLTPVITGGASLVLTKEELQDMDLLLPILQQSTAIDTVPALYGQIVNHINTQNLAASFRHIKRLFIGGDRIPDNLLQELRTLFVNAVITVIYGPTEGTVFCTWKEYLPGEPGAIKGSILGQPVHGSTMYILGDQLELLPVGVEGELCIGGPSVSSGYFKHPELTKEKFVPDPFRPGNMLYRSGDRGRWTIDGNIAFRGRKDDQVKIRGYRIELAEIERVLQKNAFVQQAVVLAKADEKAAQRLVAYIVPEGTFRRTEIMDQLRRQLPEYMVPALLIELEQMPLTSNGKINRQLLQKQPITEQSQQQYTAPRTAMEKNLAAIWQHLLGKERIGIHDNFFELGGDSIIAIQAVSRARKAGIHLQPRDIFTWQQIRELARVLSERSNAASPIAAEQALLTGECGLLPIQLSFLQKELRTASHFNQGVLLGVAKELDGPTLEKAVELLLKHHDALRFSYRKEGPQWKQQYSAYEAGTVVVEDIRSCAVAELPQRIAQRADHYQRSLDIEQGKLMRVVLLQTPASERYNRLLIIIHHLVVDGVSWRILLEDMEQLVKAIQQQQPVSLGPKSSSYRQWVTAINNYAGSRRLLEQQSYWKQVVQQYVPLPAGNNTTRAATVTYTVRLNKSLTQALLQEAAKAYHTEINDLLLTALVKTWRQVTGQQKMVVGLEGHGREDIGQEADSSRTVGWFTSVYPVLLQATAAADDAVLIKDNKEQLRSIPDKGMGFGVLKYLCACEALQGKEPWDIVFNYLGQSDNVIHKSDWLAPVEEASGESITEEYTEQAGLVINSIVKGGELVVNWNYNAHRVEAALAEKLAENYLVNLERLIMHCVEQGKLKTTYTPSDYNLGKEITHAELDAFLNREAIAAEQIESIYRLSGLQEGMLFHELYDKQAEAYVEQMSSTISHLNEAALQKSWDHILQRHSILRTAFYYDAFRVPVQCVYRKAIMPVTIVDYRHLQAEEQEKAVQAFTEEERRRGFNFHQPPLMRIALVQLDETHYRMIWTHHHILLDGWSRPVLMQELLEAYETILSGKELAAKEEDRYEDYIRYIEKQDREKEEHYWKTCLKGLDTATLLPFIAPGAERNRGVGQFEYETLLFEETAARAIVQFAQRNRVTVNTVIQAVWAYLLYRYTGNEQVIYGVTVAGRPEDLPGVEKRIGMYINTLPFYAAVNETQEIVSWLQQIQQEQLASRAWQYTPLPDVQRWSGIRGDLFDSLLLFENYPVSSVAASRPWSLQVKDVRMHDRNNYPLTITVAAAEKISVQFSYNASLLEAACMQRISGHFKQVLEQMTSALPDKVFIKDLDLLPAAEKEQLLLHFNNTAAHFPENKTLVDLIQGQAAKTPEQTAVLYEGQQLTYRQLNERSNRLACYLRQKGVGAETLVVICLERSPELLISLLGVLKAGGAYVPIDPDFPVDRIAWMLEDTAARFVITNSASAHKIPALPHLEKIMLDEDHEQLSAQTAAAVSGQPASHQLAYVIYTSGSTGRPKGVMIEHRSLMNFLTSMQNTVEFTAASSLLSVTTCSFDIAYLEFYLPLITGGTLILVSRQTAADGHTLSRQLAFHRPTHMQATPSGWQVLLNSGWKNDEQIKMLTGGEALKEDIKEALVATGTVWNLYGPTETTIWSTVKRLEPHKKVSIGKPINNTAIYIAGKGLSLAPIGVTGDLYIGGAGVARGYLNRPELTAEKFIIDPFDGSGRSRLYQTGDCAKWLEQGEIEFAGRADEQVKIRGYRIEPGEIENVLQESEWVNVAAVVARSGANDIPELIAYVVPNGEFNRDSILTWLRSRLPAYMVPAWLMPLQQMPYTNNGKINKKALPAVEASIQLNNACVPPQTQLEKQLVAIWKQFIVIDRIGIYDSLFDLGGNSILATRLVSAIKRELNLILPIRLLFELNNIHSIARYIELELLAGSAISETTGSFETIDI